MEWGEKEWILIEGVDWSGSGGDGDGGADADAEVCSHCTVVLMRLVQV